MYRGKYPHRICMVSGAMKSMQIRANNGEAITINAAIANYANITKAPQLGDDIRVIKAVKKAYEESRVMVKCDVA